MRRLALSLVFVSLILAGSLQVQAAAPGMIGITIGQLKKMGINVGRLSLGVMSQDGRTLVCYEKESRPKLIAAGQVWRLRIFRLDWDTGKVDLSTVNLPALLFDNMALSPDGKWLLVVAERGVKFIGVDMTSLATHIIFNKTAGSPGFRTVPSVAWVEHGRFHTLGYFYDEKDAVSGDAVVSIDAAATGFHAIQKVRDITALVRRTANYRCCDWFASNQAYFGGYHPDKTVHLYAFTGAETLLDLDKAQRYDSVAVGQDRVFYAARDNPQSVRLVIRDVATKKSWRVGDSKLQYTYLYMSHDGKHILVSLFDRVHRRMTTWYGTEEKNFELVPVPAIQLVSPGTIRFSPAGNALAFFSDNGVRVMRVP